MDTLYIGDIPSQYHYAIFNNGYIDLYDRDTLTNGTFTYYRVYTNAGGFYYRISSQTYNQYSVSYAQNINVSSNRMYRFDYANILIITLIISIFGVWLFNLLTSLIRKGGLLGGLL